MRRRTHQLGTLSELNITPLLDIAFVLLIIFMITAPFLAESADLIIPTSKASRDAVDPSKVFTVSINRSGELDLDGAAVSPEALRDAAAALRAQHPDLGILIRADRQLSIQDLVDSMDALKAAGIAKVAVVTKPEG